MGDTYITTAIYIFIMNLMYNLFLLLCKMWIFVYFVGGCFGGSISIQFIPVPHSDDCASSWCVDEGDNVLLSQQSGRTEQPYYEENLQNNATCHHH